MIPSNERIHLLITISDDIILLFDIENIKLMSNEITFLNRIAIERRGPFLEILNVDARCTILNNCRKSYFV